MTGSPSICPLGGWGPHIIMDGGEVQPARLLLESHHYLWPPAPPTTHTLTITTPTLHSRTTTPPPLTQLIYFLQLHPIKTDTYTQTHTQTHTHTHTHTGKPLYQTTVYEEVLGVSLWVSVCVCVCLCVRAVQAWCSDDPGGQKAQFYRFDSS